MTLKAAGSGFGKMNFAEHIAGIHKALGVPADYAGTSRLPLHPEATRLVEADTDLTGQIRLLTPEAARAWWELKQAAADAGLVLQMVSAFRSVDYQRGIIARKRDRGLSWEEILRYSAAPGYSEHHTGRAVDISTPGARPLEADFAATPAFAWLAEQAAPRGWRMSFPPNNPHGIAYEPWHWLFTATPDPAT